MVMEAVIMMPGAEIGKLVTQMEGREETVVVDIEEEEEEEEGVEVITAQKEKKVEPEPWKNLEEFLQSSSRATSMREEERTKIITVVVAILVKIGEIEEDGETPSGRRR